MNFDFSEDQKFIQHTAREYLAEHAGLDVCRGVLESDRAYARELWQGVAEMGWLGAAAPEAHGGAGMGHLELVLIAEEIGRALAAIPFSSSVYVAMEALLQHGTDEQKNQYLPRLCSGETIGTFAFGEGAGDLDGSALRTELSGGKVSGTKLPVCDGDVAGLAIVLARDGDGSSLALVDLGGEGVSRTALKSIDPSRSLARVELAGAPAEVLGDAGKGAELASGLLDRAAVIMAFEQIGSAARALEITKDFTMGRYAFGRPVASFQAIKHRMADLYAAIELARSNAFYAAWALSTGDEELGIAAAAARVAACEAFQLAGEEMIQFHGGVGFTWEYDCHLFYRRAQYTGFALGTAAEWREKLVKRLEARHAA
ncbi:MAG: acyl-CoA/acyl-ACP dehydrogenase [Myxococcales bacterium]|nr:acyl-CoA/acyl-ACP dehydrogenase [Myxococcales bacterium]